MNTLKTITGKVLYSVLFTVIIPFGLIRWARHTEALIAFPAIQSTLAGILLMAAGAVLFLWASANLLFYGKGLPMNAYPPEKYVTRGPYLLFRHPIYWGFGMWLTGWFIYTGSASGFWMVAPCTVLAMVALVMGYESFDLNRRFPGHPHRTLIDIPEDALVRAGLGDRLSAILWTAYFLFFHNFFVWKGSGMTGIPVSPLWSPLGAFVLLSLPFVLKTRKLLRNWLYSVIFSLSAATFLGLLYPASIPVFFSFAPIPLLSIPPFVLFVSLKAVFSQSVRFGILFSVIALFLLIIPLAHAANPVWLMAFSFFIFLISAWYPEVWNRLRKLSETIANSWHEWTFGKIRIINHGFYVGFGAFFGVLLAGSLAGKEYAWGILVFALIVTICAGLWAQFLEGSDKLKRPFGYYGGLAGIMAGTPVVLWMGLNAWVIIGTASVVMPWVQAMGRLRCLVNGCCHGSRTDNIRLGIRYHHPRSRVCHISGLKGELVHPTQLYAILWLTATGFVMLSLWQHQLPPSFIFGIYLVLTGLGRFVEEAYRGEVQTRIIGGLRIYQWTAMAAVLTGIVMTLIPTDPVIIPCQFSLQTLWAALITGSFVFFAMGVDFPDSNARFSRLV